MNRFLLLLRSNWITASGAVLTTLSFMAFVTSFVYFSLHGGGHGAYVGLFAFIALPAFFVLGLVLMPLGLFVYRRQLQQRMELIRHKPFRLIRVIAVLTLVNLSVVGTAGYEALHYMDSQQFCGTLCHEVMSPTYESYLDSPHARVSCVECHIGSGASWFVKSKLSGLRQIAAVLFDTYQRPIPTPVHDLRPARDTCEQCHWPDKFAGDRLVVRQHFDEDEAVTPSTTVLVLKTGGVRPDGTATGIHWHVHPGNRVTYVATDGKRGKIPWVKFVDEKGKERIFTVEGQDPARPPEGEMRTMDCVDCHNQPSHAFQEPDLALDEAIAANKVSRRLPFIRKVGLEALKKGWTRENAKEGILKDLEAFYNANGTLAADVRALIPPAADAIAAIWLRNIHPRMGITWGTYPSFTGHTGCMRCHDGEHLDADGEAISMECSTCHATLAKKEKDPAILKQLGLKQE
ncbi:MAG: NapC/NirT family cytochrome c [Planctomycetes bacterium]|nr:NapC/NirT family cytochrome c [Planctomycetota bacterium]